MIQMATKKGREQSKRETWESLKEEGNKLFSHRKYEQGNTDCGYITSHLLRNSHVTIT